jgi:6-phosphogluconolactonase
MRMTLNKSSQLVLVSAVSLLAAGLLTACGTLTVDFVYVSSAKAAGPNNYGEVDVFEVDSESGKMRKIPASPFPSGGRNPVAEATSPDQADLYVVNEDDNTIVQFVIGNDGKLYPQNTVNTPGVFPLAVATSGSYLFVADTYQPLPTCSTASPCSGSVAVFPILSSSQAKALTPSEPVDSLGAPIVNTGISASYWPLTLPSHPTHVLTPTGIAATGSGAFVYVSAYDASASPNAGYVFGFSVNSDGSLSPTNNGVPFAAGVHPSAIAGGPGGNNLYVADYLAGTVLAYTATNGILSPVNGNPFPAGNGPAAVVADATGNWVLVANSLDSNVTVYSSSSGVLSSVGTFTTGSQPVAIGIDPSLNQYVYTANFLGNTVSGFQLNATSGNLLNSQFSPYESNANPTAVAAITHGAVKK